MYKLTASKIGFLIYFVLFTTGCTFQMGNTAFNDELIDSNKKGLDYQFGLDIPGDNHDKPNWKISVNLQDFKGNTDLSLTDIDITRRFWFSNYWSMKPYVGVGLGNYKFVSKTTYNTCPSGYICWGDWTETDRDTIASGYNPHFVVGAEKKLSRKYSLVIENKYEFSKEDNNLDFSSNKISAGIKWQF